MIRILLLSLFLTIPLEAISLHLGGNSATTDFTELSITGSLEQGQHIEVFALSSGTQSHFVKKVNFLPSRFLLSSSLSQCYYIRVIDKNGLTADYAPVCKNASALIDSQQLYLWFWLLFFAIILWVSLHFSKKTLQQNENVTTGFASFVQRLHFHALERGNQVIFSTGEGVFASFQNFVGFLAFREMNATARKAGNTLPLYTSDPLIHHMALEYVDKQQTLSSIVFSGGSDLTHMLLLKREVSRLKGESMVLMVGELTPRTLLCVTPLKQEKNTVVVGTSNLDALSSLLPSTTAIGIGPELFFLLSAFQKPRILMLFRLFTVLLIVLIALIIFFASFAFFTDNSYLLDMMQRLFGGGI